MNKWFMWFICLLLLCCSNSMANAESIANDKLLEILQKKGFLTEEEVKSVKEIVTKEEAKEVKAGFAGQSIV